MHLGARAARTRVAHGPEVVLEAELEDRLWRHVGGPQGVSLGVTGEASLALEDRDLEAVFREAHVPGQELPGKGDGVLLEVVPEREVTEHLEEGVVARGDAHVLEVVVLAAGADALLGRGSAGVVSLLLAQEDVLELVHPRVREEQRRVVRGKQGGAAHDAVAAVLEVLQEGAANLVGGLHESLPCSSISAFAHGLQALEGVRPTRPEALQTLLDEARGEAPPQQEGPELLHPPPRLFRGMQGPIAAGDLLEDLAFGNLARRSRRAASVVVRATPRAPRSRRMRLRPRPAQTMRLLAKRSAKPLSSSARSRRRRATASSISVSSWPLPASARRISCSEWSRRDRRRSAL